MIIRMTTTNAFRERFTPCCILLVSFFTRHCIKTEKERKREEKIAPDKNLKALDRMDARDKQEHAFRKRR